MRSLGATRLIRGIGLATAIIVGASAQLPFHITTNQVFAKGAVFQQDDLIDLFSEPANSSDLNPLSDAELKSKGYVRDARGNIYKIRTRTLRSGFPGAHTFTTADAVARNYYLDASGLVREKVGSDTHSYDPLAIVSADFTSHRVYDFGGLAVNGNLSSEDLAQLRTQVEALGGHLILDQNGQIIGIDFGNKNRPNNYDQLFARLVDIFNQRPATAHSRGSTYIEGGRWNSQESTGDANLDALIGILAGGATARGATARRAIVFEEFKKEVEVADKAVNRGGQAFGRFIIGDTGDTGDIGRDGAYSSRGRFLVFNPGGQGEGENNQSGQSGQRSQADSYQLHYYGNMRMMLAEFGSWILQSNMSYEDKIYNLYLLQLELGMDFLKTDKISNLSDIQSDEKNGKDKHLTFWVGEKGSGYKYALTRVELKSGGLFGLGSDHRWVISEEADDGGETSYRVVSAEEHQALVAYVKEKLKEAEAAGDRDAVKDWKGILNKMKDKGLETYNKKDYDAVRKEVLDPNKSFKANIARGQLVVFYPRVWSDNAQKPVIIHRYRAPAEFEIPTAPQGVAMVAFTPEQIEMLQDLKVTFLGQYPEGSDRDFAAWLMAIATGNNQFSTGDLQLDQWIILNLGQFKRQNQEQVETPNQKKSFLSSESASSGYVILETGLRDDNGGQLFEITRFRIVNGRELDHVTEFIPADQVRREGDIWVLVSDASGAQASSSSTASNSNEAGKAVDESLESLIEEITVTGLLLQITDTNGSIQTGTAEIQPSVPLKGLEEALKNRWDSTIILNGNNNNVDLRSTSEP